MKVIFYLYYTKKINNAMAIKFYFTQLYESLFVQYLKICVNWESTF